MVTISAQIDSSKDSHQITLSTGGNSHSIEIAPKPNGFGSSANGGELLFLALATCYCNDIYREAEKRNISVSRVLIHAEGEFDGVPGHPGENLIYHATVEAKASEEDILELMKHTDTVAEIQNTLRKLTGCKLGTTKAVSLST